MEDATLATAPPTPLVFAAVFVTVVFATGAFAFGVVAVFGEVEAVDFLVELDVVLTDVLRASSDALCLDEDEASLDADGLRARSGAVSFNEASLDADGLRARSGAVSFAEVLEVDAACLGAVFDMVGFVVLFAAVAVLEVVGVLIEVEPFNGALVLLEVLEERAPGGLDNVGAFDLLIDELRVRVNLVAPVDVDVDVVVAVDFLTVPTLEVVFAILLAATLSVFFSDFSFSFSSTGLLGGVKTPLDTDFVSVVLDSLDTETFS